MTGTLIPAIIGGIRSLKDGSISITIETQEMADDKVGNIFSLRNKICYVYFSARQIELPTIKIIDSLEPEMQGKSPSLRLRNILFRCWQQNDEGYKDSDSHYRAKMELICNTYKSNLL